jgi:hypothetical protein
MKLPKWIEPSADEFRLDNPDDPMRGAEIFPSFHLWGHTFSPKRLSGETGFRGFAVSNEPGEPNVAGPWIGHPHHHPYGSGIIRPPEAMGSWERLSWMGEQLPGHTRKFCKEYGIVDSVMYLTIHYRYGQQCCLLLPPWFLRSLRDIPLIVTSVQESEAPDSFAI